MLAIAEDYLLFSDLVYIGGDNLFCWEIIIFTTTTTTDYTKI